MRPSHKYFWLGHCFTRRYSNTEFIVGMRPRYSKKPGIKEIPRDRQTSKIAIENGEFKIH